MMFQEFVNRTKLPIKGMPGPLSLLAQITPWIPLISTELFFIFVLGGEDPIDHVQRKTLKEGQIKHPLEETIMRIHIAEEARHISFARHYLRRRVPRMPRYRRFTLGIISPVILGIMARIMLAPGSMIRAFRIPEQVVKDVYTENPEAAAQIRDSVSKTRELCAELGMMNALQRRVWKIMGIYDAPCEESGTVSESSDRSSGSGTARPGARTAIVTGGASGIGRAVCRELSRRGMHVVAADIDEAGAERTAKEFGCASAGLDVTDARAVRDLVRRVKDERGRLDFMFNNAGIAVGGTTDELTLDHWNRTIDVNLRGVVHGVHAAYPIMLEQGRGHIVNTASLAGLTPAP
nr:hypothetical protein GCM10020093_042390 [Planobispora longispora]